MARQPTNQPQQVQPTAAAPVTPTPNAKKNSGLETRLRPTTLNHIFYFDVEADGRYREVAVIKAAKAHDGTIQSVYYIDIALLDNVDKGRLKAIVTSQHADKYELWDLMSQNGSKLNNGMPALDYFHQLVKTVHGPGATNTSLGGGLLGVKAESSAMVGGEFTDPRGGSLESGPIN